VRVQAVSGAVDSMHLTLSTGRQHTWRDLVQLAVDGALEELASANPQWRRSLPRDYMEHMGVMHADDDDDDGAGAPRAAFLAKLGSMLGQVLSSVPIDSAVDQFACRTFMYDRMAPRLAPAEAALVPADPSAVSLDSRVRLVSRHAARLAVEGEVACLYFCTRNSRVYHADPEPQHIDFDLDCAPALEKVLTAYPKYTAVAKLPGVTDAQRLDLAQALVEVGLVRVKEATADEGHSH
jgi:lysine-specific demethylase/histidyl-hydroxylase NO66